MEEDGNIYSMSIISWSDGSRWKERGPEDAGYEVNMPEPAAPGRSWMLEDSVTCLEAVRQRRAAAAATTGAGAAADVELGWRGMMVQGTETAEDSVGWRAWRAWRGTERVLRPGVCPPGSTPGV